VSVAALLRHIEIDHPTLLYDEIDNVFRGNGKDDDTKDLRACLNSGFKRGGKFTRCVGQHANLEVKEFATFSPKALTDLALGGVTSRLSRLRRRDCRQRPTGKSPTGESAAASLTHSGTGCFSRTSPCSCRRKT
jgi:hypothetical protein